MDDTFTGLVGLGALIVAFDMVPEVRGSYQRAAGAVKARFNPARLGVYMSYLMAAAAMFLYGYYIENDETKFGAGALPAARAVGDQVFTRAHLLLVFGSLPVIAVFLMAAELFGDASGTRESLKRLMSAIVLVGMVVATAGMGIWIFATPLHATTWSLTSAGAILYMAGQALILLGAVFELFTIRTPQPVEAETAEPPKEMPPAHAAVLSSQGDGQHAERAPHGAILE
jgi:hypothetical protein